MPLLLWLAIIRLLPASLHLAGGCRAAGTGRIVRWATPIGRMLIDCIFAAGLLPLVMLVMLDALRMQLTPLFRRSIVRIQRFPPLLQLPSPARTTCFNDTTRFWQQPGRVRAR